MVKEGPIKNTESKRILKEPEGLFFAQSKSNAFSPTRENNFYRGEGNFKKIGISRSPTDRFLASTSTDHIQSYEAFQKHSLCAERSILS